MYGTRKELTVYHNAFLHTGMTVQFSAFMERWDSTQYLQNSAKGPCIEPVQSNTKLYGISVFRRHEWNLRSSGILRSVWWYFRTDVSGQTVSPIFKDQEVEVLLKFLTIEDGIYRLFRKVGTELPFWAA